MSPIDVAFSSLGIALLGMTLVWWVSLRIKNAGIVDIAWAGSFSILAFFYAISSFSTTSKKWVFATLVIFWSLRLTTHLYRRVMKHHPQEDARYLKLRNLWGKKSDQNFFWFFLAQGVLAWILSWPFLCAMNDPTSEPSQLQVFALLLGLISILGESLADAQLKAFKLKSKQKNQICQYGLWNYSRHPNYFFEWLIWVSFSLFAWSSPWGWTTILSPALILYFLLFVTGIPPTEALALETKGAAYRKYQATTHAFIPWFKKKV